CLKIYVDGESKAYAESGLTGFYENYNNTYIGYEDYISSPVYGAVYFDGRIDDVRVYNMPLHGYDIWELMFSDASVFGVKNSLGKYVACFDSFGNLFLKGKQKTWQEWQEPSGEADEFIIEKNNGAVVYISDSGDLFLKEEGIVIEGQTPEATGTDEFRVQNSDGNDVAIIKAADGYVYLKGKLYENP
ncbi:unnamed protein product, partial [marine sediment metagenome]